MPAPRIEIPDLPEQTATNDADWMVVQNGAVTKKMLISTMISGAGASKVTNGGGVATIMTISQAAYDALSPPNPTTLYIIV